MKRSVVTLFELVKTIQETANSDSEAVALLKHIVQTRRVRFVRPAEARA